LSLPSPPQSRSSSAQDSYSTSGKQWKDGVGFATEANTEVHIATTFEENGEPRGREASADAADDHTTAKPIEGKGNVIVSVRVRPDAGGEVKTKAEGEWMVDGRRSLVAYKGREGGDYYYGIRCVFCEYAVY